MSLRKRKIGATQTALLIILTLAFILAGLWIAWQLPLGSVKYGMQYQLPATAIDILPDVPKEPVVTHLDIPDPLKAIYITACTASEKVLRKKAVDLFDGTELNAIVIDIKDYTGTLAYSSTTLRHGPPGKGCIIEDLPQFIRELHEKGIYTIARVTVFQDPLYAPLNPKHAVRSVSRPDTIWRDKKGLSYVDPNAKEYWKHIVDISKEAYKIGFDEINYDYIRFPSDGDLTDARYDMATTTTKSEVISEFFAYLRENMSNTGAVLSADLFGLTTSAAGDLGIGQILEDALPHFDYVSPMVYPSHFSYGFIGIPRPATKPYEVIKYSMDRAVEKAIAASSTPAKLRPWLQAFDLGAAYTPDMVRLQIQATYDAGLTSWMLWNAGSVYDKNALLPFDYVADSTASTVTTVTATSTLPIMP